MVKNNKMPAIRFSGYTEAWEQRKLLTVLNKIVDYRGRTPKKLGLDWSPTGHLALSALNVKMGYVDKTVDAHYGDDHLYSVWMKDNDLYEGQVLFTTEAPMGNVAQVPDNNKYILSQRTIAFVPDRSVISDNFLAVVLSASKCQKSLINRASGGTAKGVSQKTLSEISLDIPQSLSEQDKVSELIKKLSKIITLHQRKLEKLKLTKKALLQKLFPQNGSKIPELRFKGFTDAWEQRKLNDFVTIRRGLTYKPSDIAKNGIRVLRSSNIDEDQFIKSNNDVFVNIDAVNIPFAKNGDILITSANGSSRLVGKHTIINDIAENSAVHGGFMLLAESNNSLFTDALLSSNWYKRFINTYVAGGNGAIGNLSKSDLESQSVMVPSEHEQIKIGQWYGSINQLITLHHCKLELLKNIKKGLLQKMFV